MKLFLSLTASPSTPRIPITISPDETSVEGLKELISKESKIPMSALKVIYRGRLVTPGKNLSDYKFEEDCVLHCMGKPVAEEEGKLEETSAQASAVETAPIETGSTLQSVLNNGEMKRSVDAASWKTALETLQKLLKNIISNPNEEKYRKVKKGNAAFKRRLGGLKGATELLLAVGFVEEEIDGEEYYLIKPSAEAWPKLLETQTTITNAVSSLSVAPMPSFVPPAFPPPSGTGPTGGSFDNMAMNMLQNPQALQNMLSNPMVQQQMMNDPRIANNPMMRQQLQQLSNDPARLQQLSQMMSNPATRQMLSQMADSQGMGSGFPMGGAPAPAPFSNPPNSANQGQSGGNLQAQQLAQMMSGIMNSANNSNANASSASNNANDNNSQMTEEEMINEAIARSLRER